MGDDLSLFDSASGSAMALNETARDVWTMADVATTVTDVVATLAAAYRVEPSAIEADVRQVIDQLTVAGVLRPPAT